MLNASRQTAAAVLKGVSMAALLSGALATHAHADDAKIKSASFSIQPVYQADEIVVTSSDGKKWDKIDAKALKLSATMKVETKHPGYVKRVGVLLGACNNTGCANNPVMFTQSISKRDYHDNEVIFFAGNKIPVSTSGVAVPFYGDKILKTCNEHLQGDGATKAYSFPMLLTASFSANTGKAWGGLPPAEVDQAQTDFNGGDVTRQAQFAVKVTCKPYVPPPLVLKSVYFVVYKHESDGCPQKATIDVQFKTSRAGKIDFVLYRNDGAHQKVSLNAKKDGDFFRAKWQKDYTFTKSVDRKYLIVPLGHKYSSKWKPMVIKCGARNDAAGPGGVTNVPHPTHGKPNDRPVVVVTPKPQPQPQSRPKPRPRPQVRPSRPVIKVAPVARISCAGGVVRSGQCFCPRTHQKVKAARNAYRCIKRVVKPARPTIKVAPTARPKRPAVKVVPTARPSRPRIKVAPTARPSRPAIKVAPKRTSRAPVKRLRVR